MEPVYTGVTAHEQKGTGSREACCYDYSLVPKETVRMIKKSHNKLKNGGKSIKIDKSAHQEKDGLGSSGLREGLGEGVGPLNAHTAPSIGRGSRLLCYSLCTCAERQSLRSELGRQTFRTDFL